jgi:hypothetical protein
MLEREADRPRAPAEYRVRGIDVPEHRRVLEHGTATIMLMGSRLHAYLPLLRRGYRQPARLAGPRGAAQRARASVALMGLALRRADLGGP